MKTLQLIAVAVALTGAAATANAGIKASAVRPGAWVATSPTEVLVPLNAEGATTLGFKLPSAGKKVLTYSADCGVYSSAAVFGAWLDIDIYVNGVIVAPTIGTGDAFCSSNGTTDLDSFVRASITIPIRGVEGNNTVQIKARGNFNATGLFLGDAALVIFD